MSSQLKRYTGFVLAAALTVQPLFLAAQQAPTGPPAPASVEKINAIGLPDFTQGPRWFQAYKPITIPDEQFTNSPRVDTLMREGKINLTLSDAIMLAIENNIDVAIQRLNPAMADADILRAKAGRSNGFRSSVYTGSSGGVAGGSFLGGIGGAPLYGGAPGFSSQGTTSYDPVVQATVQVNHSNQPITSIANIATQSGVTSISPTTFTGNFAFSQAFSSGTQVNVFHNNGRNTSIQNALVPQYTTSVQAQVYQHLMDGFGLGPNQRAIHIAKNNREVTDLTFKLQIVVTVSQVQSLYWDLVSASEDVKVQERSLQVSQKLYNDNKRQVEIGTLAPIEVVRAEAEVASGRQNLIVSQSNYQQLGTSMKNLILKNISDPTILTAEVVPVDKIGVPPVEAVIPVQDLVASALTSRTELQQSRIDLSNRDLSIKTTKNSLLPQLDAFGTYGGLGIAGQPASGVTANPALVGGYFNSLGQALGADYPSFSAGVQLTMVLRNRSAQADLAQALLDKRQSDLRLRQNENQVRVEVANAQIALQQNRARIDAAKKQRELAEQSLDAEQKKFQLGASTNYLVIQAQRDLTSALSSEVAAKNLYMKSRVEMDRATGQTLLRANISVEEAAQGQLKRAPTPIGVTANTMR